MQVFILHHTKHETQHVGHKTDQSDLPAFLVVLFHLPGDLHQQFDSFCFVFLLSIFGKCTIFIELLFVISFKYRCPSSLWHEQAINRQTDKQTDSLFAVLRTPLFCIEISDASPGMCWSPLSTVRVIGPSAPLTSGTTVAFPSHSLSNSSKTLHFSTFSCSIFLIFPSFGIVILIKI